MQRKRRDVRTQEERRKASIAFLKAILAEYRRVPSKDPDLEIRVESVVQMIEQST